MTSPFIPKPCHEDWNKMTPQDQGRHCAICDKVVVDFTTKTNHEIFLYLKENEGQRVCGTVKNEANTDFNLPEPRWIRTAPSWQHFLLAIGFCFLINVVDAQTSASKGKPASPTQSSLQKPPVKHSKPAKIISKKSNRISKPAHNTSTGEISDEDMFMSGMMVAPTQDPDSGKVFTFVDIQPQFPGGDNAKMDFLKQNIHYPSTDTLKGIVYVNFVVNENGQVTDAKVVRSVKGAPLFDKEALRVIRMMPNWIPGKMNGKTVKVSYNQPVKFVRP